MIPTPIKKVIEVFSKFPTIGERTATRFTLYLLSLTEEKVQEICDSILSLKKEIKLCSLCFNPFTSKKDEELCPICRDKKRNKALLCIIEKETDLWQMEKMGAYSGLYFVLGGKMDFLKENSLGKLRIEEFKKRVEESKPKEIILAINPTSEGVLTMNYLTRILKPYETKITRLGRGLPTGGEIEYADDETIKKALEGREQK